MLTIAGLEHSLKELTLSTTDTRDRKSLLALQEHYARILWYVTTTQIFMSEMIAYGWETLPTVHLGKVFFIVPCVHLATTVTYYLLYTTTPHSAVYFWAEELSQLGLHCAILCVILFAFSVCVGSTLLPSLCVVFVIPNVIMRLMLLNVNPDSVWREWRHRDIRNVWIFRVLKECSRWIFPVAQVSGTRVFL